MDLESFKVEPLIVVAKISVSMGGAYNHQRWSTA